MRFTKKNSGSIEDKMNQFYSEVLLDHNSHPQNKDKFIEDTADFEVVNSSCGDKYHIYIKEKSGKIIDVSFSGTGCALSQASADMMADFLVGKSAADAKRYFNDFRKIVQTGKKNDHLGELNEFCIISKMPMRAKCAELPWTFCESDLFNR